MATNEEAIRQPTPPYIPFKTLANFINKLKETAIPPRIDRTMLRGYSGTVGGALIPALKFLSLIDDDGKTSDMMRELVGAYGTDAWKEKLKEIINSAYAHIIGDLDITCATKGMLEEQFGKTGAEKSVISKCMAFYVAAQREAGVTVSPHVTESQRGKRDPSKKKGQKPKDERPTDPFANLLGALGQAKKVTETVTFNIPVLPGKPSVQILIPENITKEEWKVVNQTMEGYISLLTLNFDLNKKEENQ